jgi:serine/threonine protein kinase
VKPSNILIDRDGRPLLADFGVAKNLAEPGLTTTGELAGTCAYMSPEQARARRGTIDLLIGESISGGLLLGAA